MSRRYTTLIEAGDLAELLGKPDTVLIDCRHSLADTALGERQYRAGHIRSAHFMHLDRDLSGPMTGSNGRHPLPDPQAMAERFGHLGIGPGVQVVACDEANAMVAVRAVTTYYAPAAAPVAAYFAPSAGSVPSSAMSTSYASSVSSMPMSTQSVPTITGAGAPTVTYRPVRPSQHLPDPFTRGASLAARR